MFQVVQGLGRGPGGAYPRQEDAHAKTLLPRPPSAALLDDTRAAKMMCDLSRDVHAMAEHVGA
jgi:hypothetical protein